VVVVQSTLFSILRTSTWRPRFPSARQPRSAGANGDPAHVNAALVNNTSRILVLPTTGTVDSEGTAAFFRDGIFRLHGLPSNLVSDRGATFTSEFSRSLRRLTGITHGFPSANGRPDRARQFNWRHASSDPLPSQLASQPEPPLVIIDDQQEWEVEEIFDSRRFSKNRLLKYFVHSLYPRKPGPATSR
jgi:hypothetical protein